MFRLAQQFIHHVLPGVMRPLRILWNQIIGFVFLVLAILAASRAIRSWHSAGQNENAIFELILSAIFFLIMASFGVGSFLRARRINRS
ncbi:MAG: hypothetical protein IT160_04020 [Bryobacterales bacterium]|nr:hypothetical protein [Bryobacterales bacterium]